MSEPCFHDDPEVNRIFKEVTEELMAMSPQEFVDFLNSGQPGQISAIIDEVNESNRVYEDCLDISVGRHPKARR